MDYNTILAMMLESLVVFILSNFSKVSANPPFACKPINLQAGHESGFSVSFYNYPFQDNDLLRDLMFMEGDSKPLRNRLARLLVQQTLAFRLAMPAMTISEIFMKIYTKLL